MRNTWARFWARFKSDRHQWVYEELMRLAWAHPDNYEWSAALFVLAATEADPKGLSRYFVDDFEGIDWDGLLKLSGPWSSGERCLVRMAAALHSREEKYRITLGDLGNMDERNFEVAMLGLRRRNGREQPE